MIDILKRNLILQHHSTENYELLDWEKNAIESITFFPETLYIIHSIHYDK